MLINEHAINAKVGINGALAPDVLYTRLLDDVLEVFDIGGRMLTREYTNGDLFAVADSISRSVILGGGNSTRTASDNIIATDQLLRYAYRNRLQADAASPSDGIVRGAIRGRTQGDAFALIDGTFRWLTRARLKDDLITLADGVIRQIIVGAQVRTLSDAILVTDSGTDFEWIIRASDYAALVDAFSKSVTSSGVVYSRTKNDSLEVFDAVETWYKVLGVVMTDEFTLDDSGRDKEHIVLASDRFNLTDLFSKSTTGGPQTYSRTQSDTISVTDQLQKFRILNRAISDGCAVTDHLMRSAIRYRNAADAFDLYDIGGRLKAWQVLAGDNAVVTDTFSKTLVGGGGPAIATRTATDTITLTDELRRFVLRTRLKSDALDVDDVGRFAELTVTLDDSLAVTDTFSKTQTGGGVVATRTASDTITLNDAALRWLLRFRRLEDAITVLDGYSKTISSGAAVFTKTSSDSITITDSAFRWLVRNRLPADQVDVADQFLRSLLRVRGTLDTVEVSDGTAKFRLLARSISDALGVTDDFLKSYLPYIQYTFDVRVRLGTAPSGILVREAEPWKIGQASTGINLGGYN